MTYSDRISQLHEAQDLLNEAHQLIQDAIRGTITERYTKAYLLDHLQIMIGENHMFLSNDENLDNVIEKIRDEFEGDEEE